MSAVLDREAVPAIREIPVRCMPPVERRSFSNGVELVSLDSGTQPVSRLTVRWPAGRLDVDERAAYNLLRPMLSEGTSKHSGAQIADIFETFGAWTTVDSQLHSTSFNIYMLNHTAGELLPLVAEIITDPSFPEDTLGALRRKFAAAVELEYKKPMTIAGMNSTAIFYGEHHPQNHYNTAEDYLAVERGRIVDMHRDIILGTTPIIYLSGKIDDALEAHVTDAFASVPFGNHNLRRIVASHRKPDGDYRHTSMPESMQTAIRIDIPVIPGDHADFEKLRIAVFALGGYFTSRLMSNIREDKGYTYGIHAILQQTLEGSSCRISCEADNAYAQAVVSETRTEVERLASGPMSPEELGIVRNSMLGNIVAMFDSPFTMMDFQVNSDMFASQWADVERRMSAVREITPEDIMHVTRDYLLSAPWYVATAGGA